MQMFADVLDAENAAAARRGLIPRFASPHDAFAIVGAITELVSRQVRLGEPERRAGARAGDRPADRRRPARRGSRERAAIARRARARGRRLPALPAAGRVARGGRAGQARRVRDRGLLGAAAPGLRRSRARACSCSAWRRPPTAATAPGRIFTGDRSGDWLFAALWRAGFANQPESVSRDDGLTLQRLLGHRRRPLRAARQPPDAGRARQLPAVARRASSRCSRAARVIVCLGGFAWDAALRRARDAAAPAAAAVRPRRARRRSAATTLLGCYHVSQQNTFTGRLTEPMLDAVFARARELAGL